VLNGATLSKMMLLRGNEVLEVSGVEYVEQDGLGYAWEDNVDMMRAGEAGIVLRAVTDAEADALYAARLGEQCDEGEASWHGAMSAIVQEATATGWRLTVAYEDAAEVTGNADAGTWSTATASGTYEAFDEWTGKRMVRFKLADGTVADVVEAGEDCFKTAWLWGLGRH
jgi:hypothetical protein